MCSGGLTPLDIPVSGFRLHPIVAAVGTRPAPEAGGRRSRQRSSKSAVDDLVESRASLRSTDRERDGRRLVVPAFHVGRARDLGRHGDGPGGVSDAARMGPRRI